MSPLKGNLPAVESRKRPTGPPIYYPMCGHWECDDDYDWDWISPEHEDYGAVRREHDIATYHQPPNDWQRRLAVERACLSDGNPLWHGRRP